MVTAVILMKADRERINESAEALADMKGISEVFSVSGRYDLVAIARVEGRAAREAGLDSVMDRCVKIEHARLFGGLNWVGVDTGIVSARRPRQLPY